jgi:ATP-dependent DNA helicase DinG
MSALPEMPCRQARRAAQEADLVVVNHHLLLADLAMKEVGFIEFLPGADAIILDEAHQIPDLAAQFFGISLGSRELERLFDELRGAALPLRDAEFQRRLDTAQTALRVLRAEAPRDEGRHELSAVIEKLQTPMTTLSAALKELLAGIRNLSEASVEVEKLHDQLFSAIERLSHLASDETWDGLRWLDVNPRSIRLNLTPLDVADTLSGLFNTGQQAWIFTSATLAVGEDFGHFMDRMGINGATGLTFPSPYALADNGLIWLPPGLPAPSDRTHTGEMLENVMPLLDMTEGGVFCLFTSHRALNTARRWFKTRKNRLNGRPLLIQGDAPRDDLLRRFREHGDAVLLGTGSFWEGVDVRGGALTIVAIDKLPFASPADPLMMARLEFIRRQGGNGFTGHQLPLAVLSLKQGAGRLLRDETDYGVVVLCDPRITSKSYGKVFVESLSPMPTTESISDVAEFLAAHEATARAAGRKTG